MGNIGTSTSSKGFPMVSTNIDMAVDTYITDRYSIGRTLGGGASSHVVEVTDIHTEKRYAMKIMDKFEEANQGYYVRETKILKMLQHPNIAAFKECHVDSKHFYIISELGDGGDLYNRIMDRDWCMTEKRASQLVKIMLLTVGYLQNNNVIHRDLKPENFVFKTNHPDSDILLVDFGCARIVYDNVKYRKAFGTPYFLAPEVVPRRRYTCTGHTLKLSDVWSIGVIAYALVVGNVPFSGDSVKDIFESILKKPLTFPEGGINLSKSFVNFCESLLRKSPNRRLNIEEALNHDWLKNTSEPSKKVEVVRRSGDRNDGARAMVRSLVSMSYDSYVYRMGAGQYNLGTANYLEDMYESCLV